MLVVLQRVKEADVVVKKQRIAHIDTGLLVLLGIAKTDTEYEATKMAEKIINLRIFPDDTEKLNLSLKQINGELLIVSQFTLLADSKKGNRPNFIQAAKPDYAKKLYDVLIKQCKGLGITTKTGQFGAYMQIHIINDGPVTIPISL